MRYKTLFLSDLHLGSHKCQDVKLYNFLRDNGAETIYLVGDVFDGCYSKRWPAMHYSIIGMLIQRMLNGARIVYIPGNHDAVFRKHCGMFGNLWIAKSATYTTEDGRKLLVTHGDETDMIRFHFLLKWITWLECKTHWHLWEILRRNIGTLIKLHTKQFERKMRKLARDYSGVICGHIHSPNLIDGKFLYMNCGDWTYHNTAIVEHHDGKLEIIHG